MTLLKMNYFAAEKGKGALMNDKKIRVSNSCTSIKSAVFGTGHTI